MNKSTVFLTLLFIFLNCPFSFSQKNVSIPAFEEGVLFLQSGEYEKSVKSFSTAISSNQNIIDSYYNRGIAYFKLQMKDEACKDWSIVAYYNDKEIFSKLDKYCDSMIIIESDTFQTSFFDTTYYKDQKENPFFRREDMAEFPGGEVELMNFIGNNLKYPITAKEDHVQGRVYVRFYIDRNGIVQKPYILKGVREDLDKEVLRIIKLMPKWKPAYSNNNPVGVALSLPVNFKFYENSFTKDFIDIVDEKMPSFPGGEKKLMEYIEKNLKAPQHKENKRINRIVYATFVVDTSGSIKNAKITRGLDEECDREVLRVINSMPKWEPGTQNGVKVQVEYNLPFKFK